MQENGNLLTPCWPSAYLSTTVIRCVFMIFSTYCEIQNEHERYLHEDLSAEKSICYNVCFSFQCFVHNK